MRKLKILRGIRGLSLILALVIILVVNFNLNSASWAAMVDVPNKASNTKANSNGDFPVRIVNGSDYLMSVALVYFDRDKRQMRCEGWWNVPARSDRQFELLHLKGRPIFYYVECQDKPYSKLKSDKGVDWRVSKIKFSYVKGDTANLVNPYKVHFVRGGPTDAGWWQLVIQ